MWAKWRKEEKRRARKRERVRKERFDMLTDQYMKLTKKEAVEQLANNVCHVLEQKEEEAN